MSKVDFHVRRGPAALVAAAILAASCSSCSSSGSTSDSGGVPKTLAEALRGIHATGTTTVLVEWGEYGGANGNDLDEVLTPILGFSVRKQPFVMTVGRPPNWVSVLYGTFDPAAIGAKLQGLGYKSTDKGDGVTQWLIRDNHKIDMNQKPEELAQAINTYNVIRVSKTRIVYGGATADLDAALPAQSASLADDPVVGEIAKCLDKDTSGMYDASASKLAVGVGPNNTEHICVAAPDDATAKRYGESFTKAVTSGTSQVTMEPWNKVFSNPKVESLGGKSHVMRLTVTDVAAGHPRLVNAMLDASVMELIGQPLPYRRPSSGSSSGSSSSSSGSSSGSADSSGSSDSSASPSDASSSPSS